VTANVGPFQAQAAPKATEAAKAVMAMEAQSSPSIARRQLCGRHNNEIAFKRRLPGPVVTRRLSVLDVTTLKDHPVAETRNVDDQAEWLDNYRLIYGLPENGSEVESLAATAPGPPVLGGGASVATDTASKRRVGLHAHQRQLAEPHIG
jgi:hypothetical protein